MHFLFVHNQLIVGGVETLIIRVARWLTENGHKVSVLIKKGGVFEQYLSTSVQIVYWGDRDLYILNPVESLLRPADITDIDVIWSFTHPGVLLALVIANSLVARGIFPICITGIYHPRHYAVSDSDSLRACINRYVFGLFEPRYIMVMNNECRLSHEEWSAVSLDDSHIMPIPIYIESRRPNKSISNRKKIVSIGRLESDKAYNIGMIYIIKQLLTNGYDITWDVYGDGQLDHDMTSLINRLYLNEHIHLMGSVYYNNIPTILYDADVFVGMGTSALESAMRGVPTICATVYEMDKSHGFLYELPYGNIGEANSELVSKHIIDMIEWIFSLNQKEYVRECDLNRNAAERYSIDMVMKEFLNYIGAHVNSHCTSRMPRCVSRPELIVYRLLVQNRFNFPKPMLQKLFIKLTNRG